MSRMPIGFTLEEFEEAVTASMFGVGNVRAFLISPPQDIATRERLGLMGARHVTVDSFDIPLVPDTRRTNREIVVVEPGGSTHRWRRSTERLINEDDCDHHWIDATNPYVSGTALCIKCWSFASLSDVELGPIPDKPVTPPKVRSWLFGRDD